MSERVPGNRRVAAQVGLAPTPQTACFLQIGEHLLPHGVHQPRLYTARLREGRYGPPQARTINEGGELVPPAPVPDSGNLGASTTASLAAAPRLEQPTATPRRPRPARFGGRRAAALALPAALVMAVAWSAPARAVLDVDDRGPLLTAGGFRMRVTNAGILGNAFYNVGRSSDPSFEYPAYSGIELLNHAELWVGAINAAGETHVSGAPMLEFRPTTVRQHILPALGGGLIAPRVAARSQVHLDVGD